MYQIGEEYFEFDLNWSSELITKSIKINTKEWGTKQIQYMRIIDNILTSYECQQLINITEKKGYDTALVNIGGGKQRLMTDVRNNDRCIIDHPEIMERIWQRILSVCNDEELLFGPYQRRAHAVGLNERMRILRYDPGTYFAPHFDGTYQRGLEAGYDRKGEVSLITAQFYLNEGFEGGATRFLNHRDESIGYDVVPKIGSVLLFQHDLYHEGSVLISGRKYALRTDVMYSLQGPGNEYSVKPIRLTSYTATSNLKINNNHNNNNNNNNNNIRYNNNNSSDEEGQYQPANRSRNPPVNPSTNYPDNSRRGRTSQYFSRNQQGQEQNQYPSGRTMTTSYNNNTNTNMNTNTNTNDNSNFNNNNNSNNKNDSNYPYNQQLNRLHSNPQPPPSKYSNLATSSSVITESNNPSPSPSPYVPQGSQPASRTRTFQY